MSNPSITADKTPWYQWDTGLTVTVAAAKMTECHFANRKQGTAYVQAVINGVARVPDELLQVATPIKAYGYVSDGAGGQTYVEQSFEVIARNIPADYTYTKTAQKTIRDAEAARDEAVQAAKDAKASELAADDSAVEASNSAQSAGESASAAATSASNAAKSAGEAAKSASDAKAAAGKAVEDASALLKTYTDNAKTSADNAATSARYAADAASAASGSASAAEQSATDASNAKVAAQTAKDDAATSASNAATSASSAADSATSAANSASDAAANVNAINVIAPKTVTNGAAVSNRDGLAIGAGASVKNDGVAVGFGATSEQWESVAVGFNSSATGYGAIAIGKNASVAENNSVAIGNESTALSTREFSVGNASFTRRITNVNTPVYDTDSSTKKYTDDNDAKTLTDAKKYTDANTSNALVGTVSGKLLHVDDAWPSKPLGLTIDGAYKQDGTPTPENPVPIEVIENPVLLVTGRNLIDLPDMTVPDNDPNDVLFDCGLIPNGTTAYLSVVSSANATSRYNDAATCGMSDGTNNVYSIGPNNVTKGINRTKITPTFDATKHLRFFGYRRASPSFDLSNYQLEVGGYHDYRPYTSASLPITLPSEHPYLAALPDGTHDEIVIDKDGNASLVARVMRIIIAKDGKWRYEKTGGGASIYYIENDGKNNTVGLTTCAVGRYAYAPNSVFVGSNGFVTLVDSDATNAAEVIETFGENNPVYYQLATPVTYPLGKLDIPSLPETISNVWTDAELTTNMSMTYKRDINIAFDNLVQSVVAAAAGE